MMKPISQFASSKISYLFTDIDDTLTDEGKLSAEAYAALWELQDAGIEVIPVTGRPAGWCEMIARCWPVAGVVGENGGLYFRYHQQTMKRYFAQSPEERRKNRDKLERIGEEILQSVPGCAVASDQFSRLFDLAIDFNEDVPPLPPQSVEHIVRIFTAHGAQAKISSIHVNGWFGHHDKLSACRVFCEKELGFPLTTDRDDCTFVGDSPNDEPMFAFFKISFAVANIATFASQLKNLPTFVATRNGGQGFVEIAERIISLRQTGSRATRQEHRQR